jgi:hypothetical protein
VTSPTSRRSLTFAAIALAVVVALAIGFYHLGRSTATPPTATTIPASPAPSATHSVPRAGYSPTDQSGAPEPALPKGPANAGTVAFRTGPADLPLGYNHDQTGAVNAATNYLIWMNSIRIADKNSADEMATSAAADEATRTAMIESFDALRTGLENIENEHMEPARGAYAVASYSDSRATIYVWLPMVITDTSGEASTLWSINAVTLVWTVDWKLTTGLVSKVGGAAVNPTDPEGNPTAEEKHSILTRTPADPGEILDSAEQSWYEYSNALH